MQTPALADMQAQILPLLSGFALQSLDLNNPQLQIAQFLTAGYTITFNSQPGRIDLVAQRGTSLTQPMGEEMTTEKVAELLRGTVLAIAATVPTARLAVIATSAFPHDTIEESFALILSKAPGLIPPAGVSEVDVRINSRATITTDRPVGLNRNVRWQNVMQALVTIQPESGAVFSPPQSIAVLTVDINSVPETVLAQADIAPVYDGIIGHLTSLATGEWNSL